jgi:ubiquitin conjugation factor E4 B
MINDVTYLMDESLSDLHQIHRLQTEMADTAAWEAQTREYRQEREKSLRQLERMASGYCDLARANVELLRIFTAETKAPFMLPEIVDKLAAMLDYNLDALAGPRVQDLRVKNREKYRFDMRRLVSDFLQVFLNLADQEEFVRAVANDGRSYRRELFERAMGICHRMGIKTPQEIEQLRLFVDAVEAMKLTIEAEEDWGEIPEEFTGAQIRQPVFICLLTKSSRPVDGYSHAQPCDASLLSRGRRPLHDQVVFVVRNKGPLQSTAAHD